MSGLSRWLTWDRERPDTDGGQKTPAFVDIPVHADMDLVVASSPNGDYEVIDRTNLEEHESETTDHHPQRIGMFQLSADGSDEDTEQGRIVSSLYQHGCNLDWENTVRWSCDQSLYSEVENYLGSFDLDLSSIHTGLPGCRSILDQNAFDPVIDHPDKMPTDKAGLHDLMEQEYAVGQWDEVPVFFNDALESRVLFSAPGEYVGIGVRILDHVGILIHNPLRGVVITDLGQ
jgi:hypothetical protein